MSFDDDTKFGKQKLPKDINKQIIDKVLYDFDNCKLGDTLKYNETFGFNLLSGRRVGQCCCTADQMLDGKSRFWVAKPDIKVKYCKHESKHDPEQPHLFIDLNLDIYKQTKLKNAFYGFKQYKEYEKDNFIKNIDGIYNTNQLRNMSNGSAYSIIQHVNDNEYIPEYYEIATACKN